MTVIVWDMIRVQHCGLAPLISGILKGPSTDSKFQLGNWLHRKCNFNSLYLREKEKLTLFFAFWMFCQGVKVPCWQNWGEQIWPIFSPSLSKNCKLFAVIGMILYEFWLKCASDCADQFLQGFLIRKGNRLDHPPLPTFNSFCLRNQFPSANFKSFPHGKKFPDRKPPHFGRNRLILAKISCARNVKKVIEGHFFHPWIGIKFHGGLLLELLKLDQPLPSNLLKTDFPLKLTI